MAELVDPAWTGDFNYPALSPEGTRLAVAISGTESRDIWVKQLDRGPSLKLTFEGSNNDRPTWMPDGGSVTFNSNRAGENDLWTKRADGSAQAVLELDGERDVLEALWSPDGEWLIYRLNPNPDILALRPGQDTVPLPLVTTEFGEDQATLSPDGRWLAYASNETGREKIYVVPFPNAGDAKWPVSTSGGREPLWSHSGRELFYRNGAGRDGRGAGRDGANVRARPAGGAVPGDGVSDRPKSPSVRCDAGRRALHHDPANWRGRGRWADRGHELVRGASRAHGRQLMSDPLTRLNAALEGRYRIEREIGEGVGK